MTWTLVAYLAVTTYLLRLAGLITFSGREMSEAVMRYLSWFAVALISGLIALQALTIDGSWSFDLRLAGLIAALVAVYLRAPFFVVLLLGVGTTALLRVFFG